MNMTMDLDVSQVCHVTVLGSIQLSIAPNRQVMLFTPLSNDLGRTQVSL